MFSIGFSELILILIIAYVFVGPQDLPKVAQWCGHVVKRTRLLIAEIKEEAGLTQLVQETEKMRKDINNTINESKDMITKNLYSVQEEFNEVHNELHKNIDETKKDIFTK